MCVWRLRGVALRSQAHVSGQGLGTPALWLALGGLSPETVLTEDRVGAGFVEMATEVRGAGEELCMPGLGSGFYSVEATEFGGQKEGSGGENSSALGFCGCCCLIFTI